MNGTPFGRFTLLELLGRGGMGEVWRAYDTETTRTVAVKILVKALADDEEYAERFRREARAAAGLTEPHIVPIHDFGEIEGRLYLDMRLIEGSSLAELLSDGPLAPERSVNIVEQIASALVAAHDIGLVHRDVKPSNILVTEDDFAYLIDFGIAAPTTGTRLTSTGQRVGTFAYLAPERLRDSKIDHRSDVYALACVLHECLTGHRPYPGDGFEKQASAHLWTPPPVPSRENSVVPPALDKVVATGMAKNLDERFQGTLELAVAARHAVTDPAHALPPLPISDPTGPTSPQLQNETTSPVHGVHRPLAGRRRWIILGSIAAAALIAAAIATGVLLRDSKPSDEEQIRQVVAGVEDAYNRSDFDAYRNYACTKMTKGITEEGAGRFRRQRSVDGRQTLIVQSIKVDGDSATAYLQWEFENKRAGNPTDTAGTDEVHFVRENGKWTLCSD